MLLIFWFDEMDRFFGRMGLNLKIANNYFLMDLCSMVYDLAIFRQSWFNTCQSFATKNRESKSSEVQHS